MPKGTITNAIKQTAPDQLAATPKMLEAMNQAKIAKINGDTAGLESASMDAIGELGVQTQKGNESKVKQINKTQGQLNEAYQMYFNMLSTPQLERMYETMKKGYDTGDTTLEELKRIESVLAQKPNSKYANVYRGGLQGLPKTIDKMLPDWVKDTRPPDPQKKASEFEGYQKPLAHVGEWLHNAGKSYGEGMVEFPAFVGMMLGDTDQDPNEFKSGFAVLMEGTIPPKHMEMALDIMNRYYQMYGEDAKNYEEYQIAEAWYDAVDAKWESAITQALRLHYEKNYKTWDAFKHMLYNDPFTIVSDAAGVLAPALYGTKHHLLSKAGRLLDAIDPESAIFNITEAVGLLRQYQTSLVDWSTVTDAGAIQEAIGQRLSAYSDVTGINQMQRLDVADEIYLFEAARTEFDAFPYGLAIRNPHNNNIEAIFGFSDAQRTIEFVQSGGLAQRFQRMAGESDIEPQVFNAINDQVMAQPDHLGIMSVAPANIEGLQGHDVYFIETIPDTHPTSGQTGEPLIHGLAWFNRETGQMGGSMHSSVQELNDIIAGQGSGLNIGRTLAERLNSSLEQPATPTQAAVVPNEHNPQFIARWLGENVPDDVLLGVRTRQDTARIIEEMGDDIAGYSQSDLDEVTSILQQYGAFSPRRTTGIGTNYNLVHAYGVDASPAELARRLYGENTEEIANIIDNPVALDEFARSHIDQPEMNEVGWNAIAEELTDAHVRGQNQGGGSGIPDLPPVGAGTRWSEATPPNQLGLGMRVVALNPRNDMYQVGTSALPILDNVDPNTPITVRFSHGHEQVGSVYHAGRNYYKAGTPDGWGTQNASPNIEAVIERVYDTGESVTQADAMAQATQAWQELGHEGVPMLEHLRPGMPVSFWNPVSQQAVWGTHRGHGGMGNRYMVEHEGVIFETERITLGNRDMPETLQAYTYDPELQMSMQSETGQGFQSTTTMSTESVANVLQQQFPNDFTADTEIGFTVQETADMLRESGHLASQNHFRQLADDSEYVQDLTHTLNDRLAEASIENPPDILDGNTVGSWADGVIEHLTPEQLEDGVDASEVFDILDEMGQETDLSDYDMNWLVETINAQTSPETPVTQHADLPSSQDYGVPDLDPQSVAEGLYDYYGDQFRENLNDPEAFESDVRQLVESNGTFSYWELTDAGWQAIIDEVRAMTESDTGQFAPETPSQATTPETTSPAPPEVDPDEITTASDFLESLGELLDETPASSADDFTFGSSLHGLTQAYQRITRRTARDASRGQFPDRFSSNDNPNPHPDVPNLDADIVNLYRDYARVAEVPDDQINDFITDPSLTHPRLLGETANVKERLESAQSETLDRQATSGRATTGGARSVGASGSDESTEGLTPSQTDYQGYTVNDPNALPPPPATPQEIIPHMGDFSWDEFAQVDSRLTPEATRTLWDSLDEDGGANFKLHFRKLYYTANSTALERSAARRWFDEHFDQLDIDSGSGTGGGGGQGGGTPPTAPEGFDHQEIAASIIDSYENNLSVVEQALADGDIYDIVSEHTSYWELSDDDWNQIQSQLQNQLASGGQGTGTLPPNAGALSSGSIQQWLQEHGIPPANAEISPDADLWQNVVVNQLPVPEGRRWADTTIRGYVYPGISVVALNARNNAYERAIFLFGRYPDITIRFNDGDAVVEEIFTQGDRYYRRGVLSGWGWENVSPNLEPMIERVYDTGESAPASGGSGTSGGGQGGSTPPTSGSGQGGGTPPAGGLTPETSDQWLQSLNESLSGLDNAVDYQDWDSLTSIVPELTPEYIANAPLNIQEEILNNIGEHFADNPYALPSIESLIEDNPLSGGGQGGGTDMNQYLQGQADDLVVDMPSNVRSSVYEQLEIGVNDITEARIDSSVSSDFEQSYLFELEDGRAGRATQRAGQTYIEMFDRSISNPPPFQLRNLNLGNMTAEYRPNMLVLRREGGDDYSTNLINWTELIEDVDPRLTPDNIHRVAQASIIQGTSLLQSLRDWKNTRSQSSRQIISDILDNHDDLPDAPQSSGGGTPSGDAPPTVPLQLSIEVGRTTPHEAVQTFLENSPDTILDPNVVSSDAMRHAVRQRFSGNTWEDRPSQVGFEEAVADIVERRRQGETVDPTQITSEMTPMQTGAIRYPTPPALRNQEWHGQARSAFWRIRDLEPDMDWLDTPLANPDRIDNRFADMRLSQFDNRMMSERVMTGADASESNFNNSIFNNMDADHVNFNRSLMRESQFRDANLEFSTFHRSRMSNADFTGAMLTETDFSLAHLIDANFSGVEWHNYNANGYVPDGYKSVEFNYASIDNGNFQDATLDYASFHGTILSDANFKNAVLNNTDFDVSMVVNADFTGASLEGATFKNASIRGAKFTNADLTRVDFTESYVENVDDWTGSNWQDAILTDQQRTYLELRLGDAEDL